MPDLALHIWKDKDIPDLYRMEFQSLKTGDNFFFDLTDHSLERMINRIYEFAMNEPPGSYAQFCFDLSEEDHAEQA